MRSAKPRNIFVFSTRHSWLQEMHFNRKLPQPIKIWKNNNMTPLLWEPCVVIFNIHSQTLIEVSCKTKSMARHETHHIVKVSEEMHQKFGFCVSSLTYILSDSWHYRSLAWDHVCWKEEMFWVVSLSQSDCGVTPLSLSDSEVNWGLQTKDEVTLRTKYDSSAFQSFVTPSNIQNLWIDF